MDKDKLFNFLREMEFNRLLSSAISTYGEPKFKKDVTTYSFEKSDKINTKNYKLIDQIDELDEWMQVKVIIF